MTAGLEPFLSPALFTIIFAMLALGVVAATLVGMRFAAGFTRAHSPLMAAFAAGLLLTIAVLHLIPEALEGSDIALWMVTAGLGVGFVLHRCVRRFAGDADRAAAMAPVFAIAIHAALDGLTYTIAFASDAFSGLATGAGLLLHKPADAAVCFILLQRAGLGDTRAALWSLAAAGVSTLVFAAATAPFASMLSPVLVASLLGLAAGVMIHVSAVHLLSHARSGGLRRAVPMVVLGAVAATGLTAAHRAGHDHHGHHHHGHGHDHHHHAHDDVAMTLPNFGPLSPPSSQQQDAD